MVDTRPENHIEVKSAYIYLNRHFTHTFKVSVSHLMMSVLNDFYYVKIDNTRYSTNVSISSNQISFYKV